MKKFIFITLLLVFIFANAGVTTACVSGFYAKLPNSSAVYYVKTLEGGIKYVFPDSKTFFTYEDSFIGVGKLTSEDQDMLGVKLGEVKNGGIMKYKANTKKLIKHVNSPRVYAVDKDQKLRWIKLPDTLLKLGYSFTDINDLNEVFFVSYEIGDPISSPVHLDGAIIKYKGDYIMYKIENGKKRKIVMLSAQGQSSSQIASGFEKELLEISPDIVYPDGEDYIIRTDVAPSC